MYKKISFLITKIETTSHIIEKEIYIPQYAGMTEDENTLIAAREAAKEISSDKEWYRRNNIGRCYSHTTDIHATELVVGREVAGQDPIISEMITVKKF